MRIGLGVLIGSSLATIVFAGSLAAGPIDGRRAKVASPNATVDIKPVNPGGFSHPIPTTIVELTAAECTSLGGSVISNPLSNDVCASKKLCVTKDNNGKDHAVCLETQ